MTSIEVYPGLLTSINSFQMLRSMMVIPETFLYGFL